MSGPFKKKRRTDDHAGLDDWLMTYADMITLLLCFFAVFLSVSVPRKEMFTEARNNMRERFGYESSIPSVFSMPSAPGSPTADIYDGLPSIVDRYHSGEGRSVGDGVDAGEGQSEGMGEGLQKQEQKDGRAPPPEGDRIRIIEMPSAAFFESGSAELSEGGQRILAGLLEDKLNAAIADGYRITVEGHTDDAPINTRKFPSNWELSTGRAAAVARFLIGQGVDPRHLSASGYADVFPKAPNRDADGNPIPENRAQNRRVVIKLEKIEKQEQTPE